MTTINLTYPQQIANTVAPTISGVLSAVGSTAIVWMIVLSGLYRGSKNVKYRLLLGMSINDIVNSLVYVFWCLPIPKGTVGVWGAIGNKYTCDFQGTMLNLATAGSFYNGALAGYYWLAVCYDMKDEEIARRYELGTHLVSIFWPLSISIASLAQDLYGVSALGCWMTPTPLFCNRDPNVQCERGRHAYAYAWAYVGIPLVLLGIFIAWSMWRIYVHVKEVIGRIAQHDSGRPGAPSAMSDSSEDLSVVSEISGRRLRDESFAAHQPPPSARNSNENHDGDENANNTPSHALNIPGAFNDLDADPSALTIPSASIDLDGEPSALAIPDASNDRQGESSVSTAPQRLTTVVPVIPDLVARGDQRRAAKLRETATQAFLYLMAYAVSRAFAFVTPNLEVWGVRNPFWTLFMQNLLYPLQGFLNVFVFLRPRIATVRKHSPKLPYVKAAYLATFRYDEYRVQRGRRGGFMRTEKSETRMSNA
jgi:hypothetical protein